MFVIAALSLSFLTQGQPILTASNFPVNSYAELYVPIDLTNLTPGNSGANQTWDFSAVPYGSPNYDDAYNVEVIPVSSGLLSVEYPDANYCIVTTKGMGEPVYAFYSIADNAVELIGYSQMDPEFGTNSASHFDNASTLFELPYTFGTTFVNQYGYNNNLANDTNHYDTYGTLITPFGTYNNVIRTKTSHGNNVNYTWYHVNPFFELMSFYTSIDGDIIYNNYVSFFKNLTFLDIPKNENKDLLVIYPNPATDYLVVNINDNQTNMLLTIYDLLGNALLSNIHLDTNSNQVSLKDFSSGIYCIKITDRNQNTLFTKKVMKH